MKSTLVLFSFIQDPSDAAVGLDSLLLIKLLLCAKVSIKEQLKIKEKFHFLFLFHSV